MHQVFTPIYTSTLFQFKFQLKKKIKWILFILLKIENIKRIDDKGKKYFNISEYFRHLALIKFNRLWLTLCGIQVSRIPRYKMDIIYLFF